MADRVRVPVPLSLAEVRGALDALDDQPSPELRTVQVIGGGAASVPPGLMRLLSEFTYRPRWEFLLRARDLPWAPGWALVVLTWVEDAYQPGKWAKGTFQFDVPDFDLPDDGWVNWLDMQLRHVDDHERGEWFVVAGKRPFDPHAPGRTR